MPLAEVVVVVIVDEPAFEEFTNIGICFADLLGLGAWLVFLLCLLLLSLL